jgi:NAD(P)-dependent dehydrogenase (short-subunit alcohol dehydrogenase family)
MAGAVIIGAGPGIGTAVARRFARAGMPVAVVARSRETLDRAVAAVEGAGVETLGLRADAADERALRAALDRAAGAHGLPDVLVYNAGLIRADRPGELSVRDHQEAWAINVVGAITAAGHLGPRMAERGSGTIITTGGMPVPLPDVTSLSLGKAGVRALTALLARAYGDAGVHVATVTVGGTVAPGTPFDPDDIAEHYWRLHAQARDEWEQEIVLAGDAGARLSS